MGTKHPKGLRRYYKVVCYGSYYMVKRWNPANWWNLYIAHWGCADNWIYEGNAMTANKAWDSFARRTKQQGEYDIRGNLLTEK